MSMLSLPLLLLISCTNSGLDRPNTTDTGDDGNKKGGGKDKENCPFVGDWELDSINCSTFPYDAWFDTFDSASLSIDHDSDGGCIVVSTLEGEDCEQVEEWHFDKPVDTDVDVTYNGIESCSPDTCSFDPKLPDCEEGARTGSETLVINDETGDLTAEGLFADMASGCPLTVFTVWKKQ